ncbi:hypothetical protein BG005_008068 [Podila minutissima]|nr:hypothetical protein BG005_008068 [Podila minutissima]
MDQSSVAGSMWPSTLLPSSMDDVERDMDVKRLLAFQANATSTTSSKVLECEPTGHLAEGAATTTLDPGTILTTNLQSSNPQSLRIDYRQQTTQHEVNCGKSSIGSRCLELSSQPHFSSSIPSPLASPITATAASLTALSISHSNNSVSQALYTRDLTKVTGPHRGHKNQIQNAIIQSYRRNEYREVAPQEQLGMSSDPETSAQSASRHVSSHKLAAKEASLSTIRRRAESSTSSATVNRTAKSTPPLRVTLHNLVSTGYLPADTRVIFRDYSATVTARGTLIPIYTEDNWATLFPWLQGEYETPSAWATAMVKGARTGKVAVNGWSAIKVKIQQHSALAEMFSGQGSPEVSLDVLRKRYLTDMVYHGSAQAETESAMGDAGKETKKALSKSRRRSEDLDQQM